MLPRDKNRNVATLPDAFLKDIGRLVVDFAALESSIAIAIWNLLNIDGSKGEIITSEMSFKNMLALFSSLFMHKTSDRAALDEMKVLISQATGVEIKRNRIVHSSWGMRVWRDGRETVVRMKTTAKISKGLKRQNEELTVEDLEQMIDEVVEANKAWTDFLYKYLMPNSPVEPPYAGTNWGKRK
jgi:hypothetical protein